MSRSIATLQRGRWRLASALATLAVAALVPARAHGQAATCDSLSCLPVLPNPGGDPVQTNRLAYYPASVTTTTVAATVQAYQTELIGRLGSGPSLFDVLLTVPYGDPAATAAVASIEQQLAGRAGGPLAFVGPTLTSSTRTSSTTSNPAVTRTDTLFSSGSRTAFDFIGGPTGTTIRLGGDGAVGLPELPLSCTGYTTVTSGGTVEGLTYYNGGLVATGCSGGYAFTVLPGQADITLVNSVGINVFQTTTATTTDLLSEVYTITGVAQVAAVPEPATWALVAAGLGGLAAVARGRRRYQIRRTP